MSREVQTKTIDGETFAVEMLDCKRARAVFVRLGKVIGGPLRELAKAEKLSLDTDVSVLAGAAAEFFAGLTEQELDYFCDVFAASTKVKGAIPLSGAMSIFDGKLTLMFKWLWFCLEVNYSDFLGALNTLRPTLVTVKAESPSTSPMG